jgi:uncharacterized protein
MPFFFRSILILFIASQLYWLFRAHRAARRIRRRGVRIPIEAAALVYYLLALAFTFGIFGRWTPTRITPGEAMLAGPFEWWVASSIVGFLVVIPFLPVRAAVWLGRQLAAGVRGRNAQEPLASPARRQFLERTATVVSAAPFVAGAYGLLYERLNLETTAPRIRLARLPRALHGFRIAQLSDIHVGPFMTELQIRKYVEITNALKPDLIVLTGDFVNWDPSTQQSVVNALAGLKAPFGIFGCLGNHEAWSRTEDSITHLFEQARVRILRQARVPIVAGADQLNLIGIDYPSRGMAFPVENSPRLEAVEQLADPSRVNILLSHTPATFDRAAELGIDLSLSGHTHGGQVALEFISPELAPSRFVTPYVSGRFEKPGAQLYVNRGIGTIGVPIRLGARPEISVFELVREV